MLSLRFKTYAAIALSLIAGYSIYKAVQDKDDLEIPPKVNSLEMKVMKRFDFDEKLFLDVLPEGVSIDRGESLRESIAELGRLPSRPAFHYFQLLGGAELKRGWYNRISFNGYLRGKPASYFISKVTFEWVDEADMDPPFQTYWIIHYACKLKVGDTTILAEKCEGEEVTKVEPKEIADASDLLHEFRKGPFKRRAIKLIADFNREKKRQILENRISLHSD